MFRSAVEEDLVERVESVPVQRGIRNKGKGTASGGQVNRQNRSIC